MKKFILAFLLLITFKISDANVPIGFFDDADIHGYLSGWALDAASPYSNLTIHFYANAPAGSPGSVYIGQTVANKPRPDVNSATGYPGNHGFGWQLPIDMITPCPLIVYAYAIDPHNVGNKHLTGSPWQLPIIQGTVSNSAGYSDIIIKASSKYGGAIYSLTWDGVQFIDELDHGRLLQSASSFYSSWSPPSWSAECYNPTEAGSHEDGSGDCTDSELLSFSAVGNVLQTSTQMAFYARSGYASSCSTGPVNGSTAISDHIMDKKVTVGLPLIAHAIKYEVTYHVPAGETNLAMGQFEVVTGYMPKNYSSHRFVDWYRYDQFTETLINVNGMSSSYEGKPIIVSTSDGNYAMGIYTPELSSTATNGYGQFDGFTDVSKWNLVRRIPNITAGQDYTFTAYLCVGSLENVRTTLAQLIATYPN